MPSPPDWECSYLQSDTRTTTAVLLPVIYAICISLQHVSNYLILIRSRIQETVPAEADRLWAFPEKLLSSIVLGLVWLIFSEWQTNWPVCHIATASHGLIQYLSLKSDFKPASFLLEIPKGAAFICQKPNLHPPTSVSPCFCLCLSRSA